MGHAVNIAFQDFQFPATTGRIFREKGNNSVIGGTKVKAWGSWRPLEL